MVESQRKLPPEKNTSGPPTYESDKKDDNVSEADLLKCPICGLRFSSEDEYSRHVNDMHKIGSSISTPVY
jgi:hypothetical protein